jgi:surface antigen
MRKHLTVVALLLPLAACAGPGYGGGGYGGGYGGAYGGGYGNGYGGRAAPGEIGVNKTTGGALVGAGLGGLAGSQVGKGSGKLAATAIGVLLGGLAGSSVGASLDRADLQYAQQTQQHAFEAVPSGQTVAWRNPDSGNAGTYTPRPAYQTPTGQYCREFQQTITVGGQTQAGFGTACRQPDGSWRIVQ